jgi:hypothetical protein
MPAPPGNTEGFASLLTKAQQTPDLASEVGRDLPDGFPLPVATHHRVVDSAKDPAAIEGMIAYDFTCRRGVFVIYRDYSFCNRCANDIAAGVVAIPAIGDYVCPHTMLTEYEAIVNKTLAGEYLFGSENEVIQKDGSIVISMKWFEKKLNVARKKKQQRQRQQAAGGPPDMQDDEPDL